MTNNLLAMLKTAIRILSGFEETAAGDTIS